jgi:sporulation protein YlmC with PRC-barrel domain
MKQAHRAYGSLLAGLAALGIAAVAVAADNRPPTSTHPPTFTSPQTSSADAVLGGQAPPDYLQGSLDSSMAQAKVDDLIGKDVLNTDGQKVGEVKEIARDRDDQSLQMIVATRGVLAVGEKRIALPVTNARLEWNQIHLTRNLSEQQMQLDVASFDQKNYQTVSRQEREETVAAVDTGAPSS